MNELLDDPLEDNRVKSRHGCVTAWLILMLILNAITALVYFFSGETITRSLPNANIPNWMLILLGVVAILNVVFALQLFQWKKLGFWGFLGTSILAFAMNVSMGLGIGQSVLGLVGIGILYAILQIKSDGVSAWDNLE